MPKLQQVWVKPSADRATWFVMAYTMEGKLLTLHRYAKQSAAKTRLKKYLGKPSKAKE